jgi:predicted RND superfamily exporter protein
VVLVPRGAPAREEALANELSRMGPINDVIAYSTAVGTAIPNEFLDADIRAQFYSAHYARLILYANMPKESDASFSVIEQVRETVRRHYPGEDTLTLGESVNLYDMKQVVTGDNAMINLFAIISITLTLLVSFRSVSLPLLLLLTIEAAIWVNLSVAYFTDTSLSYIGYLIISTVQLGATVDYAILLSDHYLAFRKSMQKRDALFAALKESVHSILLSGGIMTLAGFCLAITSSNGIVKEIGILLGRGTLLSMVSVMCFLPALLYLFDRIIGKTTLGARFINQEERT